MMKKLDPAMIQQPTQVEITELAIEFATGEWTWIHQRLDVVELFYYPPWAEPPPDGRSLYLPWINKWREEAEKELREHYAYYHVMNIRRQRWLRAYPEPRGWAWTKKKLKHEIPAPRKRIYRPPDRDGFPDAVPPSPSLGEVGPPELWCPGPSPPLPPWPRESSAKRPGRREHEGPRFRVWLFDNGIVVSTTVVSLLAFVFGNGIFLR